MFATGSTLLDVTRQDACTWVVSGGADAVAALQAYGRTGTGKAYRTDEGLYRTPIQITFRLAGCTP